MMFTRRLAGITVIAIALVAFGCGGGSVAETTASALDIQIATTPDPPRMGANTFDVMVRQPDGTPVTDAEVTVDCFMAAMPAMSMEEMRTTATLAHDADGHYRGDGQLMTPGNWQTTVTVRRGADTLATKVVTLTARP